MTNWIGKDLGHWERGLVPFGFLLLLAALFLSQFPQSESRRIAADLANALSFGEPSPGAAEPADDMAPSPLSAAGGISGGDLWLPATGHAERRATKNKNGLAEGDASGKLIAAATGQIRYPFEFSPAILPALDAEAGRRTRAQAAFRSRAPPSIAA